jgi:uncharacterized protein (TIGR00297 family)
MQILSGLIFGVSVAGIAWRLKALNTSGAVAAAIVGWIIWGLGGMPWAMILLAFFISSSALSRAFKSRKSGLHEKFSKGSHRDSAQVLANGGMGSLLAIWIFISPQNMWLWAAYLGAMATVTADTWATEIGVLNRRLPRLITTGSVVETGTSGAISLMGTLATFGGAATIGILGAFFSIQENALFLVLAVTFGGFCGAFLDSLLGATVQAIFYCANCQKETEHYPLHACGSATNQQRGWGWLNNDWVNFIASMVGAVIAAGFWVVLA